MKPPDCDSIWPAAFTSTQRVRRLSAPAPSTVSASSPSLARAAPIRAGASWPSTRSALRPVATPVAFVVNGFLVSPPAPAVNVPMVSPLVALNSNARPPSRLFERRQGFMLSPVPARQP